VGCATRPAGAGATDPNHAAGVDDASSFTIAAGIWWALSGIVAAFLGGLTAGRLSGKPDDITAAWHGLTAWAVTTIVMLWLLTTTLSAVIGGTAQVLGNVSGQAAQGAARVAAGGLSSVDPLSLIAARVRGGVGDQAAQVTLAVSELRALAVAPQDQQAAQRDRAAQALARAQNIPVDQARQQVAEYERQYRELVAQAEQAATQAAGTARQAVSWSAILAALALALGGVAGWFGGRLGTVDPTITVGETAGRITT
jgi:hypothetical protein